MEGEQASSPQTCDRCGTAFELASTDGAESQDRPTACPECGSTEVTPFDPYAPPFAGQPNPELLHLQHLTPQPPLAPGAMVAMGPYMPAPRPTSPPARWAPDPAGDHQWRWWGGSTWTDYVADDGVTTTDPMP